MENNKPVAYVYEDEQRKPLFRVLRIEKVDDKGKRSKVFPQEAYNGETQTFTTGRNGSRTVPYKLPELLLGIANQKNIYVVEGEKDVHTIMKQNGFATTSPGGASAWKDDLGIFFKGAKHVYILPDNDEPGEKYSIAVAETLSKLNIPVSIVKLPNLPEKGDVTHYFNNGGTPKEFMELVNSATLYVKRNNEEDDNEEIHIEGFPVLSDKALHGLTGKIVRASIEHSEAHAAAVLATFLVRVGAAFGRRPWIEVGDDIHHGRLFAMVVGATGSARKGTSLAPVKKIFNDAEPRLVIDPLRVASGLSSGEGLIYAIRDAKQKQGEESADEGVADKRLMVIESEFAGALRSMQRQGNTLSNTLRDAWDHGNLGTMVKRLPIKATDAHICVLGHITDDELLKLLDKIEMTNGLVNRFLWFCARRTRSLPFPEPLSPEVITQLGHELANAIRHAQSVGIVNTEPEAAKYYAQRYNEIMSQEVGGIVGEITARGPAQIRRLALIYSLLDLDDMVRLEHFEAANAVWEYCLASAKYIFTPAATSTRKNAKTLNSRIIELLKTGEKTQTELLLEFKNTFYKAPELKAAFKELQKIGKITFRREPSTGGKPPTIWSLTK